MRVKWLHAALHDLDTEVTYLAQKDEDVAKQVYITLREKASTLGMYPQSGKPGRVFGTRELVIRQYPYIIPYRVHDDTVEILRVFHTSRKVPPVW